MVDDGQCIVKPALSTESTAGDDRVDPRGVGGPQAVRRVFDGNGITAIQPQAFQYQMVDVWRRLLLGDRISGSDKGKLRHPARAKRRVQQCVHAVAAGGRSDRDGNAVLPRLVQQPTYAGA